MALLFKNKTTLSPKSYLDFETFHQKENNFKYYLYTLVFSLLFIICISFQITAKNYLIALLLFLCFATFLAYRFFYPYQETKKEYHSDKVQNNLVNNYFFYENYFKVKNSLGNSQLKYSHLYKVYENEQYFYLYLDKNYSFILEKSCFLIGTSQNFKQFIKKKVGFKFKHNLKP